ENRYRTTQARGAQGGALTNLSGLGVSPERSGETPKRHWRKMPLISVIIPMRNAERYVRAAVESVLAQKDVELEVIVVDDGSTDGSAEVVRGIGDARVRIIPGPQKGISASFNAGLAEARGELLARCDADDLYPPE